MDFEITTIFGNLKISIYQECDNYTYIDGYITTTLGKGQQMINNNVHLATDQTLTINQDKNLALTAKISAQLSTMLNQLSLKAKHVILQTKRKTTLILKKNAVIQNMICLNAV